MRIPHVVFDRDDRVHRAPPRLEGVMESNVVAAQLVRFASKSFWLLVIGPLDKKDKSLAYHSQFNYLECVYNVIQHPKYIILLRQYAKAMTLKSNKDKRKEGEIKPQHQYVVHCAPSKGTELAVSAAVETKNSSNQC